VGGERVDLQSELRGAVDGQPIAPEENGRLDSLAPTDGADELANSGQSALRQKLVRS
jgi:hypothetical protein